MWIVIAALIAFIVGGIVGVVLMCFMQIKRIRECVETLRILDTCMENEKEYAILEDKNEDYIKGMSQIIELFRYFYKEELN